MSRYWLWRISKNHIAIYIIGILEPLANLFGIVQWAEFTTVLQALISLAASGKSFIA